VDQPEPAPPLISLPDRLTQLRLELQATCVWVADLTGKIVIQVGEMPEGWGSTDWKSIYSATSAASLDVSRALQRDFPENYHYVSGIEYDMHAVSLGWKYSLLVAAPHRVREASSTAMQGLFRYSTQILSSLAEFLANTLQEDASVEPSQADGSPADKVDTGQLVEVIQHAGGSGLDVQEIDEFWDALADQQDIGEHPEAGSLSYEQARKLGLTPEE
jgi:hypothetical protein